MLQQCLVPEQVFLSVMFAVKFALLDAFAQAAMVDEVAAVEFSQKGLLLVGAHQALKLLNLNVKFLALNNIPTSILAEIAR
jgi:hypothetical protein